MALSSQLVVDVLPEYHDPSFACQKDSKLITNATIHEGFSPRHHASTLYLDLPRDINNCLAEFAPEVPYSITRNGCCS